jgi:hypothetical protein
MSDQPANPALSGDQGAHHGQPTTAKDHQRLFSLNRSWKIAGLAALIMILLALVGVGLTNLGSSAASAYWVSLVPIYGLLCIGTAWARTEHVGLNRSQVLHQLLHWLGIGVALGLDFVIRGTGEETGMAAGMNALLLLGLGCFLAGVHLEWMFAIVGVLLMLTLILVTKTAQYGWLIAVVIGLAIVIMFTFWRLLTRSRTSPAAGP